MAVFEGYNLRAFEEWLATRPDSVKELAAKLPPNRLYRFKSGSKSRVTMYSYCEDGTVTVTVSGDFNLVSFERNVFGVKPDELEECDFPPDGEQLGVLLTDEQDVEDFIDAVRPSILANKNARE